MGSWVVAPLTEPAIAELAWGYARRQIFLTNKFEVLQIVWAAPLKAGSFEPFNGDEIGCVWEWLEETAAIWSDDQTGETLPMFTSANIVPKASMPALLAEIRHRQDLLDTWRMQDAAVGVIG